MNLSAPFVRRPVATSLLAVALLLAGMLAFRFLPVAALPKFDFPTISISANLPGASPETMASAVATPLERRFGRIAGITEITSSSTLGSTSITLQFDLDRDVEAAAREVQGAIAAASGELPRNLPMRPNLRKVNPADAPILIVSVTSKTVPLPQVFETANTILAQKISQVEGVGQVFVGGGQQPAVRVRVDPLVIASAGLSMEDVRRSIAQSTASGPKGTLGGGSGTRVLSANDQQFSAAEFREVLLTGGPGAGRRLGDVATVTDDVENQRVAGWTDAERSVLLFIRREPGANILETNDRVKALLPTLISSISPAIDVEVAMDRTQSIRASVREVELTLVLSIVLVVLVVFVFLRSGRATLVPSVVVPLSLVGTFGIMYLLGYSIDNLSLMALTIATGFVVDDAIVVVENVARLIEEGHTPLEAALLGSKQIGFTIVSITLSLLAVFVPILFMGGVVGRLFREFAVTLSVAVALSAVLSLTLTPMLAAKLLRMHPVAPKPSRLERAFDGLARSYERSLFWVMRRRWVAFVAALAAVVATGYLFVQLPKGLFPQQDVGQLMGSSQGPPDIAFSAMKARQEQINAIIDQDPDIDHAVSFVGGGMGSAGNTGMAFIALKPFPARKASADAIVNRLREKLGKVDGIQMFLQAVQDIRLGGRAARSQYQYTLQGANLDDLRTYAPKLVAELRKNDALKDVNSDQENGGLQLSVHVDRDTASRLGVDMRTVDDSLYDAFGQRQVATAYSERNQYRVILEVAPAFAGDPSATRTVYLKTPGGGMVPLDAISTQKAEKTPLAVTHQGQTAAATLSFNLAPGVSLGHAVDVLHDAELAVGMPATVRGSFQGTAQAFQSTNDSTLVLILTAIAVVYLVLGMLYESLLHPITILTTLPPAGVGALLALTLFGLEFSVIAMVGIILLVGIVKKNAILVLDFALELERGEAARGTLTDARREELVVEACLKRFRPILMTTAAALFGALPLAVSSGIGAEFRRPLGVTIVGGLLLSQLVTLYTTPVAHLALAKAKAWTLRAVRPSQPVSP